MPCFICTTSWSLGSAARQSGPLSPANFADSPDLGFEPVRVYLGDDHFVAEYVMTGTRDGKSFACDGTDVFTVSDGLVARKDSYVDWVTYQQQTGVDVAAARESA